MNRTLPVSALCAAMLCLAAAPAARGQIPYVVCKGENNFACAHLKVPLDPSGAVAGTVSLALERHRAPLGESHSAIVALAGGPGQAALPLVEGFTELLGTVAAERDLIVFDQRGTGKSEALSCKAFSPAGRSRSLRRAVAACGAQLGPKRAFYGSAETVADIEAIRRAGGYEKLVLYGTSYGTKVAEQYAEAYPEHVEALVLDSVVPPAGPDPLDRPTFAAIPRVLEGMCARRACAGLTRSPVRDLTRLLALMHGRALKATSLSSRGRPTPVAITASGIFELLLAGDFAGLLRAQLVTDTAAAARGDDAPLARLYALAAGSEDSESNSALFDLPLYFATECEDVGFPFDRAASAAVRLSEGRTATLAQAPAVFAPFSAALAFRESDIPTCSAWPYPAGAPAPAPNPPSLLPNVPALILSGANDLRTPTSNAQEVAAAMPEAKLVVVPHTGHSVLGTEPGSCASDALKAFFAGHALQPCKASRTPALLRPSGLPPRRLAALGPAHGYHGRPGRTLTAVKATLRDFGVQLVLHLITGGGLAELFVHSRLDVGGLRAGWAGIGRGATITFHDYSYVPGVTVSGTIRAETGDLRIGGSAAAHGTLRPAAHHLLVGRLAGERVHISTRSLASAAIVGEYAAPGETLDPRHPGLRRLPHDLAGVIGWLLGA
jgi:pimeloyl-ACP methyl ester carboxylesterase